MKLLRKKENTKGCLYILYDLQMVGGLLCDFEMHSGFTFGRMLDNLSFCIFIVLALNKLLFFSTWFIGSLIFVSCVVQTSRRDKALCCL